MFARSTPRGRQLGGGAAGLPRMTPGRGRVVGDRVGQLDPPVGDPAVDQLQARHDVLGRGQHVGLGAARAGQGGPEHVADLDLDPGVAVPGGRDRRVLRQDHRVEQVTVVGLVDAHHLLHDRGGEADLVAAHPGAGGELAPDVDRAGSRRRRPRRCRGTSRSAGRSAPGPAPPPRAARPPSCAGCYRASVSVSFVVVLAGLNLARRPGHGNRLVPAEWDVPVIGTEPFAGLPALVRLAELTNCMEASSAGKRRVREFRARNL